MDTTIADIARELGVGHGTFYRYFDNKRDIAEHVVEKAVECVASVVEEEDPTATDSLDEYREQTIRVCNKLFDLFLDDPDLAKVFFYVSKSIDPKITARIQDAQDLFASFTERYLRNGIEKGFLRSDLDSETTAFAANSLIFEAAERLNRSERPEAEGDRWIKAATRLIFDGVGA